MNKGLLWLNVFLVLAVGVLFFLYFTRTNNGNGSVHGVKSMNTDSGSGAQVRIGYFDMDSIEANFSLFKEMQTAIGKMEDSMNNVINAMKNNFQRRYEKFQTDRFHFTQEQLDSAGMELTQYDNNIKLKNSELNQLYQTFYMNKQQEIISYIKQYIADFNKDGKYSYILANEPGLIYYKDTAFNITSELLHGLNQKYAKNK